MATRQELINDGHLPNFEDISQRTDDVIGGIKAVALQQRIVDNNELEMTELWMEMCARPDFKPGRSNAERDIKMFAEYPGRVQGWKDDTAKLEDLKTDLQIKRLLLDMDKTFIDLAKFLLED